MQEYFLYRRNPEGLINSINLNKCIQQHLWSDSTLVMYQLPKIGEKLAKALHDVTFISILTHK